MKIFLDHIVSLLLLITKWILNFCNLKISNQALFNSFPDFDDQTFSVAREASRRGIPVVYLKNSKRSELPLFWLQEIQNLRIVNKISLKGILITIQSKWIFFTHGLVWAKHPRRNQEIINLWHGIPFKTVGIGSGLKMPYCNFIVSSSKFTESLVAKMYVGGKNFPRILPIGLPRNDLLIESENNSQTSLKSILWLPTYRESTFGEKRKDGLITGNNLGLTDEQVLDLDNAAYKVNLNIFIKAHPMAKVTIPNSCKNIQVVAPPSGSLYRWITEFDALLTDYSSVALDFAFTAKPVFLLACDKKEYSLSRGFFGNISEYLQISEFYSVEELYTGFLNPNNSITRTERIYQLHQNKKQPASKTLWDYLLSQSEHQSHNR